MLPLPAGSPGRVGPTETLVSGEASRRNVEVHGGKEINMN